MKRRSGSFVVGFVSQKGGVGKSTLSRALAREAANNGLTHLLADLDIQQTSSFRWGRKRNEGGRTPEVNVQAFLTAKAALAEAGKHDVLILDGPARASSATREIAEASTLLVQPTGASIDDLEPAVLLFHELVKAKIPRERLVFALARVGTDAEEDEARAYIKRAGYTALKGCLYERPAYRQAQNAGLAITETHFNTINSRADKLIQAIIDKS